MNHIEHEPVLDEPPVDLPPDPEEEPDTPDDLEGPSENERVQAAIAATRADAVTIAELCQLAGHPERIAGFLAKGVSEAQVRRTLLALRAERAEIASRIHPDAAPTLHSTASNPVVAAVKKLIGKE